MTTLSPDWREFFEALLSAHVEFVAVGALAVGIHAEPRLTEDLDVLVRPTIANGRRLRGALIAFGFSDGVVAEEITDPRRVWMLGRKPFRIDILTSIDGVSWKQAWAGRVEIDIDGVTVPILGLHELIANKRAAGRPKDLADLDSIARVTGLPIETKQNATSAKPKRKRR